ncbi:MAG: heterodisulfide reductase subunit B [Deltaproteobacteria bacterium]|nr:heterodisulfide reductase subunit B [Deltaproteobacteria bacterium]
MTTHSTVTQQYLLPRMNDAFYLTPSCILGSFSPAIEPLISTIYELLGIRGKDTVGKPESQGTCCSGILFHGDVITLESTLMIVARLWHVAAEAGFDSLTTACVTSFGVHQECLDILEKDRKAAKIVDQQLKKAIGRELIFPKRVLHASEVFYMYRSQIAKLLLYRLVEKDTGRKLNAVDHVGCHYNKLFPKRAIGGMEFCEVLTGPIVSWGGAEVDYPERRHCCGMGFRQCMVQPNRGYTMACVLKKMRSMASFNPDLILTNCPGCQQFLDKEQWAIWKMTGEHFFVPVLNYAELAGLLLGYDPYEQVGIQCHSVPVEPLLDKIGIPYNRDFYLYNEEVLKRNPLTYKNEKQKRVGNAI